MAVLIFKQGNFTETGSLAYAEPIFFTDANTLIISGGVSTYANTEVSPSIPIGRVGYRVATIDAINTGSFLVTGDVSASNLLLDGNATIRGNITMGGSGLDFGDASDDNVVFKADISSSILPNNDDSFDLGSNSQRWKNGYLSNLNLSGSLFVDGGPIDLHSDTYISASAGTFLDVDVTGAITINGESTTAISSSGALSLNSETGINIGTTTDKPIDIDASTLDIDASGALTIDSSTTTLVSTGSIYVNSKASTLALSSSGDISVDSETSIKIGTEQDVLLDIHSARLDLDATGKITIDSSHVDGIQIGTAIDRPFKVESSTFDIDSSGAITINGESTTAISSSGALSIDSETGINIGTTSDKPIDIDSTTLDIDASSHITISGSGASNIDIDAGGNIRVDAGTGMFIGTAQDVPIDIDASTFDVDASGAVNVDSTSTISLDGVGNSNFSTDAGNLTITNTSSGNMTLRSAGAVDIDGESGKVTIDGTSGIDIGVASDTPIDIDSTTFDLDASGNITLDSATGINVGTVNSGVPISIGHTTSETTVNDNLTVTGNFTVNGTTTYVSSSNVTIGDRIIELNYLGATGNGGIYVGDADGTTTSGSLLWDSTNDNWIAGPKDLEHKILLENGDSIISGSGTNNQITTFTGTHGVDSSANLTFDGSNLRLTGTQEITGNLSGSSSGSFKNINVAESQLIGNDLYVGGTIFHKDDTDTKIVLTDNNINITVGDTNTIAIVPSGIVVNEGAQNLDVRIEGEADNKLFFTDASTSRIGVSTTTPTDKFHVYGTIKTENTASGAELIKLKYGGSTAAPEQIFIKKLSSGDGIKFDGFNGSGWTEDILSIEDTGNIGINTNTPGEKLTINGNVSGSASGSFLNVNIADNLTVDGVVKTERLNVTSSENILATFESTDAAAKIVLKDVNGEGARFSYLGSTDTVGIGQSNTHNEMAIHINNNERVAIGSNHTIPHAVLDVSGSLIVSGTQEIKFGDLTVHETGSFGRVSGHILATNGVISGSSQIDHDTTTNFVANEHIDHSSVSITAGTGLNGGGDLTSTRTLNVDDDYKNTSLNAATGSYLTSSGSVAFSDITSKPSYLVGNLVPGNNVTITSGSDTLKIEASGGGGAGTISGSSQIDHDATTNFVAGEHFLQSAITTVGTVTTGNVQAILPSGTISGSSQVTGIGNGQLSNSAITISGTSVSLGSSITDETLFGGTGVLSGSGQVSKTLQEVTTAGASSNVATSFTNTTSHQIGSSGTANLYLGNIISPSSADKGARFHSSDNDFFLDFQGDATQTWFLRDYDGSGGIHDRFKFDFINAIVSSSGGFHSQDTIEALGGITGAIAATNGVVSSSAQITALGFGGGGGGVGTLQQVTDSGSSSDNAITVGDGTNSTSKTTGALIVSGGLGVLNTINAGGDVIAFASSDERLKDNIKPIENPLEKLSQISGNTFDWNSEKQNIYNGKDYGVIAQEIQKVMPELVDTRDSGYLAVKYDKIVPLLIESIKELKKEIEELKSK